MSIFKKLFNKSKKTKSDFYTLPVVELIRETEKAISLVFDKPTTNFDFSPGQYLTLKATINGVEVRRAYSLSSLPSDNFLKVTVKETPNGYFSKYVNQETSIGDLFDVLPPKGNFKFIDIANAQRHIIGFAGGSGITPIMSILKSVLVNEPKSKFTLFYGNTKTAEIIFQKELDQLLNKYPDRFNIIHILSEEPLTANKFKGFINEQMVQEFASEFFNINETNLFYLCGPSGMTEIIDNSLQSLGVNHNNIKTELFSAPINTNQEINTKQVNNIVPKASVKIIYHGEEKELIYDNTSKTLLDLALDNNITVPYSCMNGVCSSCSCKLVEGNVHMANNYTLEKEELNEGYILSCQSKPTTQNIVVNFDNNRV